MSLRSPTTPATHIDSRTACQVHGCGSRQRHWILEAKNGRRRLEACSRCAEELCALYGWQFAGRIQ